MCAIGEIFILAYEGPWVPCCLRCELDVAILSRGYFNSDLSSPYHAVVHLEEERVERGESNRIELHCQYQHIYAVQNLDVYCHCIAGFISWSETLMLVEKLAGLWKNICGRG